MKINNTEKILISACLLGESVRYDGKCNRVVNDTIQKWLAEGRLVPICPEVAGGLSTPRAPAEIQFGSGADVIAGGAKVINIENIDVTENFIVGANLALTLAKNNNCRYALLAAKSPSCGNNDIYDGHFIGQLIVGQGTTAALLEQHGVKVFNQNQITRLISVMES